MSEEKYTDRGRKIVESGWKQCYEYGQLEERIRIIRILQETLDESTYKRLQNKIYDSIVTD